MNELAAKLKRLEDAHNAVYWNAEQRREAMDAIFAEDPVVSLAAHDADVTKRTLSSIVGMMVSMDVSVDEQSASYRIFGVINELMDYQLCKGGKILLAEVDAINKTEGKHALEFYGINKTPVCSCGKLPLHHMYPADSVKFNDYMAEVGRTGFLNAITNHTEETTEFCNEVADHYAAQIRGE